MTRLRRLMVVAVRGACLAVLASALAQAASPGAASPDKASTVAAPPAGTVKGTVSGTLHVFKGIPYAVPPVGERRFRPPEALPAWKGARDASAFGPACPQPPGNLSSIYASDPLPMSEDCLTLNIWAPAGARKAPVFFWIHGGALWTGSSREAMYDGARLASRGLVVVSINYRLGVLGWLAHPELSAQSPQGVSGNYGLLDQIAALKWVQRNIAAFGGDPSQVTIAGESAGALSVLYLMVAPDARNLFARAISESGYMIAMPQLKGAAHGLPSGEDSGVALAAALKAPGITGLRAMEAGALTKAAAAAGFGPWGTVDGRVLPEQMTTAFDQHHQAPVAVLAGFNAGEIRSLRVLAPPVPASAAEYEKAIRERYGDLAEAFLRLYPATDLQESILATTRDALYGWTAERLVRRQSAQGQDSYLYLFDHGYPAADSAGLHAFHASELPFVFGTAGRTPPQWPKIPATPEERALSEAMIDYWSSFARTGRPESRHAPAWPAYGTDGAYLHVTGSPQPQTAVFPGMYALHEAVVCRRLAAGNVPWNWNAGLAAPVLPPAAQTPCG